MEYGTLGITHRAWAPGYYDYFVLGIVHHHHFTS